MGTNDAYMGINGHICIQNVPPLLAGGFRGAKPPKLPFSAPYKHIVLELREIDSKCMFSATT